MTGHIVIEKVSNSYAQVHAENSILQELCDYFTFTQPGSQFSPAVKERHWDGKTRLFSTRTNQIYTGLIPYIKKFCKDSGYTVEYLDEEESAKFPIDTRNIVNSLSIPDKISVRDYQYVASSIGLTKKRAVIVSPTGSGKSLIIYIMIRHLLNSGKKRGLLIVPTVNLVSQMHGDFKQYSQKNGWNVDKYCQKIHGGQTKIPETDLVISTWQSIFEMPKKYFEQFDFVVGDEAHTFKASSLTKIMKNLVNCDVRVGTTGTLDGTKVHKLILEGLFGKSYNVAKTKQLMDRKQLAELSIKCLILKYPEAVNKACSSFSYHQELEFLFQYEERNKFIRDLALNLKGNTLILFTYVDKHGRILYDLIKEASKDSQENRKVFFIYGGVDADDREQMRHITEKEKNAIIIASYGTMSTGANIRNLHNIIFSSPTKSKIRALQSIGRVLRISDTKSSATLYDIADDMRYSDHINFALKHFEERVHIYSEEKFLFTNKIVRIG